MECAPTCFRTRMEISRLQAPSPLGLDYPGVGPEHAYLHDSGRATYVSITDDEAMQALRELCREEGIIPAIESAHALAYAFKKAKTMTEDQIMVVNLSGRGDKDVHTIAEYFKDK